VNAQELRSAIIASDDLPREPVEVPWVDEKLYIRGMSANDKDHWLVLHSPDLESFQWKEQATASLVAKCLVTEDGERIFSDDDIEALGEKNGDTLTELRGVAMRLSGMNSQEAEVVAEDFAVAQNDASDSG
jgi:hypothetical protein